MASNKGAALLSASVSPALFIDAVGKPGIVVVQEWWGVDYEVKEHVR